MFSKRLKELRVKNGITQKEFSEIMNVSQSTVAMWESNKREPDFKTVQDLADYFDVSTDYLLGKSNTPNPINVPQELDNVPVAFHRGEFEDLTQDELDKLALFAKFIKEQRP